MKIGDKLVGNDHPCFIIAEAGVNHDGDIRKAKKFDVVITTGSNTLSSWWFSDFFKMPVIFQPLGYDLREAPFLKNPWDRIIIRHSIKKMAALFIGQVDSLQAAKKLNFDNYIKWITIPQDIKELKENLSQD